MLPCINKLNPIRTHGRYGAVKTSRPRKLRRVSGFRRDQMYTSTLDRDEPRNGIDVVSELNASSDVVAYSKSHEKVAGDAPEPCSSRRE
jgi:hypothetical protein